MQQLTAAIASPGAGAMTGVQTINGQSFVDVTYTVPAYATGLDVSSVTDLTDEFTIAPVSSSAGTIALDDSQAPVLLSQSGSSYTFRYWTTGTMRSGNVQLTFIGNSVSFTDALGGSLPLFAPEQVTVQGSTGSLYIVVPYGTTTSLDAQACINGDEFTVSGGATASSPTAVSGQPGSFKYTITGIGRHRRPAVDADLRRRALDRTPPQRASSRRPRRSRSSATRTSTSSTRRRRRCRSTSARSPTRRRS